MDRDDLLTDLQLNQVVLLSSHFEVSENSPSGSAELTITFEASDTSYDAYDEGVAATTRLTVTAKLVGKDSLDTPNMKFEETVAAVVSTMATGTDLSEDAKSALRYQCISEGYAFIRGHAMQLAGVSPMVHLVLPSIDVSRLMNE